MTSNLGDAAYRLVLDARGFEQGATLTGKAAKQVAQTIRETTTPTERLASRYDAMTEAFEKGALPAKNYERFLQKLNEEAEKGTEQVENYAGAYEQMTEAFAIVNDETEQSAEIVGDNIGAYRDLRMEVGRKIPILGRFATSLGRIHPAAIAAGIGVGALVAGLAGMARGISNAMNDLDDLAKTARPLGIDPAELMQLGYVAERSAGMTADAFQRGYQRVLRSMGQAQEEGGRTERAFHRLGLSVDDLQAASATRQMTMLADAFSAIEDPAQRAHEAQIIFGRGGDEMLGLMLAGSDEIERLGDRFERITGITSLSTVEIERANDAWADAKLAMSAAFTRIAADNAEAIADGTERFADAMIDLANSGAMEAPVEMLKLLIDALSVFGTVQSAWSKFIDSTIEGAGRIDESLGLSGIASRIAAATFGAPMPGRQEDEAGEHARSTRRANEGIAESFNTVTRSVGLTSDEIDSLHESAEALTANLREQVDTYGMSGREVEVWRLEQQAGRIACDDTTEAIRKQIGEINRLGDALDDLARKEQARADAMRIREIDAEAAARRWEADFDADEAAQIAAIDRALHWQQQIQSEEERAQEQARQAREEIRQLFDVGLLNEEEMAAALEHVNEQLERFADEPIVVDFQVRGLEAAAEGTQAFAAAIAGAQHDARDQQRIQEVAQQDRIQQFELAQQEHERIFGAPSQTRGRRPWQAGGMAMPQLRENEGSRGTEQTGLLQQMVAVLEGIRNNTEGPPIEIEERTIN